MSTHSYDGEIRINTALEADGFKAGSKEIEAAANRMAQSVSKIGDNAKIALQKQVNAFIKQNQMYAKQEQKVRELQEEYKKLSNQKIETEEFVEIGKQIDRDTQKLNQLEKTQEKFLQTGGKSKSSAYQKREMEIEELRNSIRYAKGEQDALLQSGNAYKPVDTSGIQKQLFNEEQKLAQMNSSLGTSWQSLKAKIVQCNGSLSRTLSLKQQLKNIFTPIISSTKRASKSMGDLGKRTKVTRMSMMRMLGTSLLIGTAFRLLMAVVNGFKQGMNNLAQYSGGANKDLSALKSSLTQLKNSFATAFAPILTVVTPILTGFINTISAVVSKIGMLVAALTGKSTFTKAIAVQEDYAASLSDTAKATKQVTDYSTSLDEINKASSNSGSSGGVAVSDMFSEEKIPSTFQNIAVNMKEMFAPILAQFQQFGTRIKESTSTWFSNLDWTPLITSVNNLMISLEPLTGTILNGLGWAYENVLLPLASWTIQEAVPAVINLFAGALDLLSTVLSGLSPLVTWLWDNFLQPIAEWTGGIIVDVINWLADALTRISDWIKEHQGLVETFVIIVGSFAAAWNLVNGALTLWNILVGVWNSIGAIATAVTTAFGVAVNFLTSPITLVALAIGALIAIVVLLVRNWDTVKEVASRVLEGIKSTWSKVSNWFKTKVLDPLANGFKGMVNGVIGFLNIMIQGIVSGVNAAIKMVNKLSFDVPDWVPELGGKTFGFNLKTMTAPQIPYLAKGAVIPPNAPFMAMLGDQKHGTNIEAPLDTIKQAVAEVIGNTRTGGGNWRFTAQINRRTLFDEMIEEAKVRQMGNGRNPFELA